MARIARLLVASVVAAVALTGFGAPSRAEEIPLPGSMASTGDSITRAFDIGSGCFLLDCAQYSWSTGAHAAVASHYQRILAANPSIEGRAFNFARTGARMADLDRQVKLAADQQVEYLTVLMGANDLCTRTIADMTPTETFKAQFHQALTDFFAMDANAYVFVASIPDIYQLWLVLHENPVARFVWRTFGICPSMLSAQNTEEDRQRVVTQEVADNAALAEVCAAFANCLWDGYVTYDFGFPAADVSIIDYFHPNFNGQNDLAEVTWAAGFWPNV